MAKTLAPSTPPRTNVLAPRYQTRFACIGGACEDTCCSGWSISIDADHFREMRRTIGATKQGKAAFEKNVRRIRTNATTEKYALIVLDNVTKKCGFLDGEGMCGVHRKHGEALLPDICATYPRRQSYLQTPEGERFEVSSVLSCPEAARLALLPRDAMELVEAERSVLARQHFMQLHGPTESLYEAALDPVRAALLEIVSSAPTTSAGLATAAALADTLGESFAREPRDPIAPDALLATLQRFVRPEVAANMARELPKIAVPLTVPMQPLLQILAARVSLPEGNFAVLLGHAVARYHITQNTIIAEVAEKYAAHRDAAAPLVDKRLDDMLRNFVLHYVFSTWYTFAPNLGVYIRGVILRVALLRFLVFAHPDIQALVSATEGDAVRTVERVLVEVVYKMARDVDHHGPFVHLLDRALPATMPGLEHAITLLLL